MTKDTEALREALEKALNERNEERFKIIAFLHRHEILEALATPASAELGFDPPSEVGDEVFPHDTIGSHFGNGGGLDPAAGDGSLRKAVEGIGDDYMTMAPRCR